MKKYIRFLVILPIRIYQRCVSPFIPPSCRFYPTCSAYAAEAVAVHGVFAGLWLALRRILRCHPFNAGGWDPVPPRVKRPQRF
ncbi:MAG: membrane protein insertion efficiency factor YidD [Deltaproteobacteria bacterium]|nr:membrane protein insertion efficiency factor YidD [Deltaproteobacteria bacterium]